MKELRNQGIIDNTYIIFMSDNGRPFPRGKTRMYDSGVKNPIYFLQGEKRCYEALISTVDLTPTILELADIEQDLRIQGKVSFNY